MKTQPQASIKNKYGMKISGKYIEKYPYIGISFEEKKYLQNIVDNGPRHNILTRPHMKFICEVKQNPFNDI
jgi:hypothetical protein